MRGILWQVFLLPRSCDGAMKVGHGCCRDFRNCFESFAFLEGKVVSIFLITWMTTVLVGNGTVSLVCRSLFVLPETHSIFGAHGKCFSSSGVEKTFESEVAKFVNFVLLAIFLSCCTHKVSDRSLDLLLGIDF